MDEHRSKGFVGEEVTSVRVAVRVRPQTGGERAAGYRDCVVCNLKARQTIMGDKSFTYDYLYDQESTQQQIYSQCVRPLMEASLSGYNATVFAYGQTGSGKTYTMGSSSWRALSDSELGVLPRAFRQIFDAKTAQEAGGAQPNIFLRASFIEIHNEELHDLLAPAPIAQRSKRALTIREDQSGGIYVAGAEECDVGCFGDLVTCLEQGCSRRATGSTEMNTHSSRSHAIFSVTIEQHMPMGGPEGEGDDTPGGGGEVEYITSKFHFVDLAGSERIKKTKAEGDRMREGISINGGLLALGNVISALGDDEKRVGRNPVHVPYRDSKLTRMLQDSLGGNSRTLMIACISPADANFEESLSTLKYANRARNIKNTPVINRDPNSHLIAQLRKEIGWLRHFLKESGVTLTHVPGAPGTPSYISPPRDSSSSSPSKQNGRPRGMGDGEAGKYFGHEETGGGVAPVVEESARTRELEGEVARMEGEAGERLEHLDLLKRGLAEIYLATDSLGKEVLHLRGLVGGDQCEPGVAASLETITRLLKTVSEVEEGCRLRAVLRSFPAGEGGVHRSHSAGVEAFDSGGGAQSDSVAARLLSPREGGGVGMLDLSDLDSSPAGGAGGEDGWDTHRSILEGAEGLVGQIRLQGQLNDIDTTLLEKEKLLNELVKNQRDFDNMRNTYERKMEDMQKDIRQIEEERDKVLSELTVLDRKASELQTNHSREDQEKRAQEGERFRERLRVLEEELKKMRKKMKDHQKLLSFKEQGESKIAQLSSEVARLKDNRIQLHQKMARDQRGYREKQGQLQKEIQGLRRNEMQGKKTIRELEMRLNASARAEHVSKRRAQIAAERQKSEKETDGATPSGLGSAGKKKWAAGGDVVSWFSEVVHSCVGKKEAEQQVNKSEKLKKQLASELKATKTKIQNLPQGDPSRRELSDEVEYLEAELEFRNIECEKAKAMVKDATQAAADVKDRVETMTDGDVRRLVPMCFSELVMWQQKVQGKSDELREVSVNLVEAKRSLEESRMQAIAKHNELDSKLTQVQREYEEKLMFVFRQLEEARTGTPHSSGRVRRNSGRRCRSQEATEPSPPGVGGPGNRQHEDGEEFGAGGGGKRGTGRFEEEMRELLSECPEVRAGLVDNVVTDSVWQELRTVWYSYAGADQRRAGVAAVMEAARRGGGGVAGDWGRGQLPPVTQHEGGGGGVGWKVKGGGGERERGGGGSGRGGRVGSAGVDKVGSDSHLQGQKGGGVGQLQLDRIQKVEEGGGRVSAVGSMSDRVDRGKAGGGRQAPSELANVADVLQPKREGGKSRSLDRRARVDELVMKVNSLWEANQASEMYRAKFKAMTSGISSKPEQSHAAYEHEYREQLRLVSQKVDADRARIEQMWEELGITEPSRQGFVNELEAIRQGGDELGCFRLCREEASGLEGKLKTYRDISGMMDRRADMLRALCDDVEQQQSSPSRGPSEQKGRQERIKNIIREYPKLVARIKRYALRWEEADNSPPLRHAGSNVVESVTNGDPHDSLLRAMHIKLMGAGARMSPDNTPAPARASPESFPNPSPPPQRSHATAAHSPQSARPHSSGTNAHHQQGTMYRMDSEADGDKVRGSGGNKAEGGLKRAAKSEAHISRIAQSSAWGGGSGGSKLAPTTSAMAARFEALKKTYAQVRSRSTAGLSGREAAVRSALQEKGLLPSPRDHHQKPGASSKGAYVDTQRFNQGPDLHQDEQDCDEDRRPNTAPAFPDPS